MTPAQLRYFLAVCGTKNFTRAARRCAVSQPSLTNAIKALEDEMGGALFIRRPQIQLTILGRALRPHFRSIIKAIDKTPQIAAAFVVKSQRGNGRAPLSTPQQSDPRVADLEPQPGHGSEAQAGRLVHVKELIEKANAFGFVQRARPRGIKVDPPRKPS